MQEQSYELSDPHDDNSATWLNRIISKRGQGLTATDLKIIFDPNLPAGTVEENLNYIPLGFDFLHQYAYHFQKNWTVDGIHDFWENLCKWAYNNKEELLTLGKYDMVLQQLKLFIEKLLRFEWNLKQEIGLLCYVVQLLKDCLGKPILRDIAADFPRRVLEAFHSNSERDCAVIIMLFSWYHDSRAIAPLIKSVYTPEDLKHKWNTLSVLWQQEGEVLSPSYHAQIEWELAESKPYIFLN